MAETFIGLDLSYSGIKAVLLNRGLVGFEWVKSVGKQWPEEMATADYLAWLDGSFGGLEAAAAAVEPPEPVVRAITELWGELGAGRSQVAVSLPVSLCSIRTISLPFSDERRISQVVPYEIESLLPFPLDEVVIDYQVLHMDDSGSRLLVAAVRKTILNRFLGLLSRAGIDPEMVELDALALFTLSRYGLRDKETEGVAVVDIGARKTSVLVTERGSARYARTFYQGGQDWTRAIAEAHSLPLDEAEGRKRRIGMTDGDSGALTESMGSWAEELNRTLHVAQAECEQPIGSVVLCGGGARLKGIEEYLRDQLGLKTENLELPLLKEKKVEWDGVWSQAMGLALKGIGVRQASRINFRKGEFAHQEAIQQVRQRTLWVWVGLAVLILLGGADLAFKYRLESSQYAETKKELRQTYREMFPDVKNIVDEVQQAQTAVDNLKKKAVVFGLGRKSALGVLGEITLRIPKDVKIEVQELTVDPDRVRMQAEAESFDAMDKIKASLQESEILTDAVVSNAKTLTGKDKVRFDLTMKIVEEGMTP
jgi:general secretion pathway protein L